MDKLSLDDIKQLINARLRYFVELSLYCHRLQNAEPLDLNETAHFLADVVGKKMVDINAQRCHLVLHELNQTIQLEIKKYRHFRSFINIHDKTVGLSALAIFLETHVEQARHDKAFLKKSKIFMPEESIFSEDRITKKLYKSLLIHLPSRYLEIKKYAQIKIAASANGEESPFPIVCFSSSILAKSIFPIINTAEKKFAALKKMNPTYHIDEKDQFIIQLDWIQEISNIVEKIDSDFSYLFNHVFAIDALLSGIDNLNCFISHLDTAIDKENDLINTKKLFEKNKKIIEKKQASLAKQQEDLADLIIKENRQLSAIALSESYHLDTKHKTATNLASTDFFNAFSEEMTPAAINTALEYHLTILTCAEAEIRNACSNITQCIQQRNSDAERAQKKQEEEKAAALKEVLRLQLEEARDKLAKRKIALVEAARKKTQAYSQTIISTTISPPAQPTTITNEALLTQLKKPHKHRETLKSILKKESGIRYNDVYYLITNYLGGEILEIGNGSSHKRIRLNALYSEIYTTCSMNNENSAPNSAPIITGGMFKPHGRSHNDGVLSRINIESIKGIFERSGITLDLLIKLENDPSRPTSSL